MPDRSHSSTVASRIAVVDVGSNSLRLVVYERLGATLLPLLNEKVMCALGRGIAVSVINDVVLADRGYGRIQVFDRNRILTELWGTGGSGPGEFSSPWGVAVSPSGLVFVTDEANNRVEVFGELPTPSANATWGQVKDRYRK